MSKSEDVSIVDDIIGNSPAVKLWKGKKA